MRELADFARDQGSSREEALQATFQAILVSPHFLFRVEQDPGADDEDGIRELNGYELASRLSYFLWSSMPDEELFELAREGALGSDAALRTQVQRMLQDPKADALVKNFAGQWLMLRDLQTLIVQAPHRLEPGAWLLLEHGWDQAVAVRDLLSGAGLVEITSWQDLAGVDRVSGGRHAGG